MYFPSSDSAFASVAGSKREFTELGCVACEYGWVFDTGLPTGADRSACAKVLMKTGRALSWWISAASFSISCASVADFLAAALTDMLAMGPRCAARLAV